MGHGCPVRSIRLSQGCLGEMGKKAKLAALSKARHPEPLVAAVVHSTAARAAILDAYPTAGFVPSCGELVHTEFKQHPRLYFIEAPAGGVDQVLAAIDSLRRGRPLASLIVWMPHAKPTAVRDCFLAGATDVLVTQSVARVVESVKQTLQSQRLLPMLDTLSRQRSRTSRFENMLSRSQAMWDLFELCARIAATDATVLIVGETGTGKDLLARAIHRRSQRAGRFVAANCASLPSDLINSELFGYEKGAFTGADRARDGLVTHADHGTLLLDEIGDMTMEAQQSLLRVLQERRVRPVGSVHEREVDIRVVAATHVPLDAAVRQGEFREDLFYRLDVIRMNVPPLRERPEDVLLLFGHFVKLYAKQYGLTPTTFSDGFFDALTTYEWPGNVRQLENFAERLVLSRPQRALTRRDFSRLRTTSLSSTTTAASPRDAAESVKAPAINLQQSLADNIEPLVREREIAYLRALLQRNQGRIGDAAQQAGINRRTLLRKMKQYELDKDQFKL